MILIYSITLFSNAALIFLLEPMIAKMILPFLGGSPAVWNASLFFFQSCLLAGYAYAHFVSSWLGVRLHAVVHIGLLAVALFFLPIAMSNHWLTIVPAAPTLQVLAILCVTIGAPFFALCAGAPLLQKWFAESSHAASRDPYFLYVASNLGSMLGLLAYPFWWERQFSLHDQSRYWSYGYFILILLTAASALSLFLSRQSNYQSLGPAHGDHGPANHDPAQGPSLGGVTHWRRLLWVTLAMIPSSLLLGVTSYITTDIASAPLFWTVPLFLYLLSFVVAFGRRGLAACEFVVRRQALLLIVAALTALIPLTRPVWLLVPLHLFAFFVTSLVCHGQLSSDRPETSHLTEFYLWISLGGAIGGLFNALVAPVVFKSVVEYPLAMVAAAVLRPYVGTARQDAKAKWLDLLLPISLVLLFVIVRYGVGHTLGASVVARPAALSTVAVLCLAFAYRPIRFCGAMAMLLLAALLGPRASGTPVYTDRGFFGVYRVVLDAEHKTNLFFHGTTLHGTQGVAENTRLRPTTYFHPTSPSGQVLSWFTKAHPHGRVAIVGLGTGSLACYGTANQVFTFFEIDPLVERIARNSEFFTFLRDCPPANKVVIGDARLSLARVGDQSYDLFVLDAFSSDAIPVHLLTKEAIELYLAKTKADGSLIFHISNRHMDLRPVLARAAKELNLVALAQNDSQITEAHRKEGKTASLWMILSRKSEPIAELIADPRWRTMDGTATGDLWTDDYSNILRVMRW